MAWKQRIAGWAAAMAAFGIVAQAAVTTPVLSSSRTSPQPVGTSMVWKATASDIDPGTIEYQFSWARAGQEQQVWRDFSSNNLAGWTPEIADGEYTIQVTAKNASTGSTATGTAAFKIGTRLNAGLAAVNPTAHPLVALFSAPACGTPNSMRVVFQQATGAGPQFQTTPQPCRFGPSPVDLSSMNFLVAGMYGNTTYTMYWETLSPAGAVLHTGAKLSFTTGAVSPAINFPAFTMLTAPAAGDTNQPVLYVDYLSIPQANGTPVPTAIDMSGNILWYLPSPQSWVGRTEVGGNSLGIWRPGTTNDTTQIVLREYDLAGNVTLETSAAAINEKLAALGLQPINGIHHDARRIYTANGLAPNGDIVMICSADQVTTTAQGATPQNPLDILGDQVVVLDHNLNLVWVWNSFLHQDINRKAILGEVCQQNQAGCEPFNTSFAVANDWLHSNTIYYTPWDGNLILSERHQDWVLKLAFQNGAGDGHIVWYLGGNLTNTAYQPSFTLSLNKTEGTADLGFPWFSHQHDAQFAFNGKKIGGNFIFTVFDNGNTRRRTFDSAADSRCQVYSLNETGNGANLNINADVGTYSFGLGTTQILTSGNLWCDSGLIGSGINSSDYTVATEQTQATPIVYSFQLAASSYRIFRMQDLYTPPVK